MKIKDFDGGKQPAGYKSSQNGVQKTGKKKSYSKNRRAIKILIVSFCTLLAAVIAIGIYFVVRWKSDDFSSLQTGRLVVLAPEAPNAPKQTDMPHVTQAAAPVENSIIVNGQAYVKNNDVVNLLFLGIDTNAERKQQRMGYRSDMIMVCAVDTAAKKATLISIPRDTRTTVYKIDDDTGDIEKTMQERINAAYAYGGGAGKYSFVNTMACVEMFLERRCELEQPLDFELDIPVYLYAGIDMDGIPHVAKAVGGVEVTLSESVPGVGSQGQTVTLKGQNTVEFLTNRHDTAGADTGRAARQQQFMIALAKKIQSKSPVDTILSLYDELDKYVWTKLTTDQMIDFAKVLTQTNIDSIDLLMVPGEGKTVDGTYYIYHDEAATLQMLLDTYYTRVS